MNLSTKFSDHLLIAGEWIKASAMSEAVINPATEAVIGYSAVGGRAEVDAGIAAAREAFDRGPWPRMSPAERAAKLQLLHDRLAAKRVEILQLLAVEAGAVAAIAAIQFDFPMALAKNALEISTRGGDRPMSPGVVANATGGKSFVGGVVRREPAGVVAAITPYNFPFFLNIVKLFPALAVGNAVVLKPSPYTPFAAFVLAEVANDIGLPRGVLSVVTGGKEVGEQLTTDPRVDLISFTGSDTVGSAIMAQAASSLKRLHFELGGKSAFIVRGDANLPAAVAGGMHYLVHSGQGCALTTRHIVHNSIRKQYVEALAAAHRSLIIGDPADAAVNFGPLIRESQRARTEYYVEEGLKSGAKLVTGGRRPISLKKGFFYEPTLFDDVDNKSKLGQEEVFGPVGAVMGFDTDEQAVSLANDSPFGLSGSVWSSNLGAAFEIACAVRTGSINVNGGGSVPGAPFTPFGGFKRSGFGREWGEEGVNAFTELKTISFRQI